MRMRTGRPVARRVMMLALAVLVVPLVLLVAAGPAAARSAPTGTFTLHPGQTVYVTNANVYSAAWSYVYLVQDGSLLQLAENSNYIGTNYAFAATSYSNTTSSDKTVLVALYIPSAGMTYLSNHTSTGVVTTADHALLGYVKGKVVVSINDNTTTNTGNSVPTALGDGSLNVTISIKKTPSR